MSDDRKLSLPMLKKPGGLNHHSTKKKIQPLDISKQAELAKIRKSSTSVKRDIAQSEQGLDLVLVGDLTTSMIEYHQLLKEKFHDLCNSLFPIIERLRIGIIFYMDHDAGLPYLTRASKLSSNVEELHSFIEKTPVLQTGNSTDEEAAEDAFFDIINLNWREIGNRSVVLFGDAWPHEPEQCPNGRDYFELTKQMHNMNVVVNSVYCGRGREYSDEELQQVGDVAVGDFSRRLRCQGKPYNPNFFSWIANVTGGMIIGIEQIDDLIDMIKTAAAKDSGNLDEYEKKIRENPSNRKLNLISVAKKSQRRQIEAQSKKLLGK